MVSRHIPIKISRAVRRKFAFRTSVRCGFPGCRKPAVDMHHTKRFSLTRRHELEEIIPLCKIHHELAHAGLIGNEENEPSKWYLKKEGEEFGDVAEIDKMVRRQRAIKNFNKF